MNKDQINTLNTVIANYFENNSEATCITAKELMPDLVKAAVFTKDEKNGLPLRKVLRELDKNEKLAEIPTLFADRNEKNTYWYFLRPGTTFVPKNADHPVSQKTIRKEERESGDEFYILNLCDEILGVPSSRQHTFSFLMGDYHSDGRTRTKLPVDAYYSSLKLVLEFFEKQNTGKESSFDKSDRLTISGVSREEQRKLYDARKRDVLADKEIELRAINYSIFECDRNKKIIRNPEQDKKALESFLKAFLKK